MRSIRITVVLAAMAMQSAALAVEIQVGDTSLEIPSPAGYGPVTQDMQPYWEMARQFVPASNEQFADFLPESELSKAKDGEMPEATRRFYVQTTKQLAPMSVTSGQFVELKDMMNDENNMLRQKIEQEMPGAIEKINQGMAESFSVDLGLSDLAMVPLPPHEQSDRSLAYSAVVKLTTNDASGTPTVEERIVTTAIVHVKAKVLFLYTSAESTALEWSRTASKQWADAVIAANPTDKLSASREAGPSGFNWDRVINGAIIGAIVGGLVGGIRVLLKRR